MIAVAKSRPSPIRGGEWAARFIFIAGRLSIDFTQTGGESADRAPWERLQQPSDLADWFAESDLGAQGVTVSPQEFKAALVLREALWQAAQAIGRGEAARAGDIEIVNRAAAAPDLSPQLGARGSKHLWHAPLTGTAALSAVARDAVELFSGGLRSRIRKCANPKCGLMFVDASRPGKRRWCLMERCGNMAKTASYRKRHA